MLTGGLSSWMKLQEPQTLDKMGKKTPKWDFPSSAGVGIVHSQFWWIGSSGVRLGHRDTPESQILAFLPWDPWAQPWEIHRVLPSFLRHSQDLDPGTRRETAGDQPGSSTWRLQWILSGALNNRESRAFNAWEENSRWWRRPQDSKGCIHTCSLSLAKCFWWHGEGGRTAFHDTRQQEFSRKQDKHQRQEQLFHNKDLPPLGNVLESTARNFYCCFGILSSGKWSLPLFPDCSNLALDNSRNVEATAPLGNLILNLVLNLILNLFL